MKRFRKSQDGERVGENNRMLEFIYIYNNNKITL